MSSTVVIASTPADSAAAEKIVSHHTEMVAHGGALVDALVAAVSAGDAPGAAEARDRLIVWSRADLLPHAAAEETTLYPAAFAAPEGRLLITAMRAEHRAIRALIDRVAGTSSPIEAASAGVALREVFTGHVWKENELIVPLLAADSTVSLTDSLDRMHQELAVAAAAGGADGEGGPGAEEVAGAHDHGGASCGCGGDADPSDAHAGAACGCGGHESEGVGSRPVLDARAVPHAIRHATVFGALDAVPQGRGLELIAPHDPLPLLAQIERRSPGAFEISYLERGPENWRLAIDRRVAV